MNSGTRSIMHRRGEQKARRTANRPTREAWPRRPVLQRRSFLLRYLHSRYTQRYRRGRGCRCVQTNRKYRNTLRLWRGERPMASLRSPRATVPGLAGPASAVSAVGLVAHVIGCVRSGTAFCTSFILLSSHPFFHAAQRTASKTTSVDLTEDNTLTKKKDPRNKPASRGCSPCGCSIRLPQ